MHGAPTEKCVDPLSSDLANARRTHEKVHGALGAWPGDALGNRRGAAPAPPGGGGRREGGGEEAGGGRGKQRWGRSAALARRRHWQRTPGSEALCVDMFARRAEGRSLLSLALQACLSTAEGISSQHFRLRSSRCRGRGCRRGSRCCTCSRPEVGAP